MKSRHDLVKISQHFIANTNYVTVESLLVDFNKLEHPAFTF